MKKLLLIVLFLMNNLFIYAQRNLVDEYEVNIGMSFFQGDYGQKNDFTSTLGSTGFVLGGKAYFNILDYNKNTCYPCQHFKFPLGWNIGYASLNFDKTNLDMSNPENVKLKAFRGNILHSAVSFGFEYHVNAFNEGVYASNFLSKYLDPYLGVSIGGTTYAVNLKSDLGDIDTDPNLLPEAFRGGIYEKSGIVAMVLMEIGMRYRLSEDIHITLNNKWIYYANDKVDGLVPNPDLVDNDHNDWQFIPTIGAIIILRYRSFFVR